MALSKDSGSNRSVVDVISFDNEVEEIQSVFDPAAAGHFINLLTDMYPHPVPSAVREVISNAIDAVMLLPKGSRRVIRITSPTTLTPVFIVEDNGVGMTVKTLQKNFVQYGNSTKKANFNQIGNFGLGAKAPLSYTNEFTIKSTKEGYSTTGTVSRRPDGVFSRIPDAVYTGEDSGTTIIIPVQSYDILKFRDALDSYRKFSLDVDIIIDGEPSKGTSEYVAIGDTLIESESEVYGRVYVRKTALNYVVTESFLDSHHSFPLTFVLGGWVYRVNSSRYTSDDIIIELKPGVVDFSSSRDEITSNQRLELMLSLVESNLLRNPEKLIERVVQSISHYTDSELVRFVTKLPGLQISEDSNLRIEYKTSPLITIDKAALINDNGFDVVSLLKKKTKITTFGLVGFNDYSIRNHTAHRNGEFLLTDSAVELGIQGTGVGSVNSVISHRLENPETYDFTRILAAYRNKFSSEDTVFTFVTGINELNLKKFFTTRKLITEIAGKSNKFIMSTDDKISSKELALYSNSFGLNLTTKSMDSIIAEAVALRKERSAQNKALNPKTNRVRLRVIDIDYSTVNNSIDFIDAVINTSSDILFVDLEDIMEEECTLVLTSNSYRRNELSSVLRGAINNGFDYSKNRKLYYLDGSDMRSVKAAQLNLIEKYENLFCSPQWSYGCASAKRILANRSRYSNVLAEEVKNIDRETAIYTIFSNELRYKPFSNTLKFMEGQTENKRLKGVLRIINGGSTTAYPNSEILSRLNADEQMRHIKTIVDDEELKFVSSFADLIRSIRDKYGDEFAIYRETFNALERRSVGKEPSEIEGIVMNYIIKRIENLT